MASSHPRRTVLIVSASVIIVIVAIAIAGVAVLGAGNGGLGRAAMVLQGQIVTHDYGTAKALPANYRPGWIPSTVTAVSVEVPGGHSKIGHPVELQATLADASTTFPSSCTTAEHSFPWDTWPDLDVNATTELKCGSWTETIAHGHLYAWRFTS